MTDFYRIYASADNDAHIGIVFGDFGQDEAIERVMGNDSVAGQLESTAYAQRVDNMKEKHEAVFKAAINEYGALSQILMLFEEMGELTASLNQMMRGRVSAKRVAEEVSDVKIMLDQLSFAIQSLTQNETTREDFNALIEEIYFCKVNRLAERLCGF